MSKEREAFDKWHYEQYLLENPNIDISNAKYIYDYAHKNALVCQLKESHFLAWQAAKAKAVPEGFVLIPKKMPDEVSDQLWDFMTDNFVCVNDYGDSFMACDDFDLDKIYAELIEATVSNCEP